MAQTITCTNTIGKKLAQLPPVVEVNRRSCIFHLAGLHWVDGQSVGGYALYGARILISLPALLPPARSIVLSTLFEATLPARRATLGYTAHQINLGDWYPFVSPHLPGRGWLMHEPDAAGEHLVYDGATCQVDLHLAGKQTDLAVAASAPAEIDSRQRRHRIEGACKFTLSVSSECGILYGVSGPAATRYAPELPNCLGRARNHASAMVRPGGQRSGAGVVAGRGALHLLQVYAKPTWRSQREE